MKRFPLVFTLVLLTSFQANADDITTYKSMKATEFTDELSMDHLLGLTTVEAAQAPDDLKNAGKSFILMNFLTSDEPTPDLIRSVLGVWETRGEPVVSYFDLGFSSGMKVSSKDGEIYIEAKYMGCPAPDRGASMRHIHHKLLLPESVNTSTLSGLRAIKTNDYRVGRCADWYEDD